MLIEDGGASTLHTFQVASVAWAPDGMLLASGGAQQVSVWDARSGKTLYTYRSQTRAVVAAAWSPDGKRLACSGNGGEIEVWEHPQTPVVATCIISWSI